MWILGLKGLKEEKDPSFVKSPGVLLTYTNHPGGNLVHEHKK